MSSAWLGQKTQEFSLSGRGAHQTRKTAIRYPRPKYPLQGGAGPSPSIVGGTETARRSA